MRTFGAVAAVALALLVSACAQEPEPGRFDGDIGNLITDARAAGLDEESTQFKALADGTVTLDEYRRGAADAIACVEAHGIVVARQYINRYDSWRLMWDPDVEQSKPQQGADDRSANCSTEHVMYLEIGHGFSSKDRVDARLLAHASGCLRDISGTLDPSAQSITALIESTQDHDAVLSCLETSMSALFPDESAAYVK